MSVATRADRADTRPPLLASLLSVWRYWRAAALILRHVFKFIHKIHIWLYLEASRADFRFRWQIGAIDDAEHDAHGLVLGFKNE